MGIPGQPKVESFGSAYSDNAYGAVSILTPSLKVGSDQPAFAGGCFVGAILMFHRMLPMNVTPCDWKSCDRSPRRRPPRVTFKSGMV